MLKYVFIIVYACSLPLLAINEQALKKSKSHEPDGSGDIVLEACFRYAKEQMMERFLTKGIQDKGVIDEIKFLIRMKSLNHRISRIWEEATPEQPFNNLNTVFTPKSDRDVESLIQNWKEAISEYLVFMAGRRGQSFLLAILRHEKFEIRHLFKSPSEDINPLFKIYYVASMTNLAFDDRSRLLDLMIERISNSSGLQEFGSDGERRFFLVLRIMVRPDLVHSMTFEFAKTRLFALEMTRPEKVKWKDDDGGVFYYEYITSPDLADVILGLLANKRVDALRECLGIFINCCPDILREIGEGIPDDEKWLRSLKNHLMKDPQDHDDFEKELMDVIREVCRG